MPGGILCVNFWHQKKIANKKNKKQHGKSKS